ncbi:DUF3095 domain-containing protein [Algibacter pacificus]|uniref:DUF3095 domain-containing protein n=1 Tax=Algibacter pacificus TaxID=2599389 RepID=UPI001FE9AD29|nr:DUF3095 domain-containing protein [Algibacter pacificus]
MSFSENKSYIYFEVVIKNDALVKTIDLNFYKNISKSNLSLSELLKDNSLFFKVPSEWFIVITDIENSTNAVSIGLHNEVNLSATGSIITVLNTLKKLNNNIKIPYFFGGDGATFIMPKTVLPPVLLALNNYSQHIKQTTQLNLRVGHLQVQNVYDNQVSLRISKVSYNKYLTMPVVLGNGLKYAEDIIKARFKPSDIPNIVTTELNLDGMECRWDKIYPNKTDKKVVCILVDCDNESIQAQVYSEIINAIDVIFGTLEQRNPISTKTLKLDLSIRKIKKEMYARLGKYQLKYLISNWFITFIGVIYFKFFKAGKKQKQRIVKLTDTLMIDGVLNTVISGTYEQVDRLKITLDNLEKSNKIIYGIHVTHASIMSCYIEDRQEKHIHFVDGTEGGYTSAAMMFKEKLKKVKARS